MMFFTCREHEIESRIGAMLSNFAGQGFGGEVVKDRAVDLSAPEAARWTGKKRQLAFCRSGQDVWLELRARTPYGWAAMPRVTARLEFTATITKFVVEESA